MSLEHASASPSSEQSAKGDRTTFILVSLLGFLLFLGIVACAPGTGLVIKVYNIPSSSMAPTLHERGYAVVSRIAYGYSRYTFEWFKLPIASRFPMITPQRGDVVAFKLPRDGRTDYIKRIVGLPGDTVQVVKGRVFINGQMIAREPIARIKTKDLYGNPALAPTYRESLRPGESHTIIMVADDHGFYDDTPLVTVPEGQYFVMGDNRDNSTDSRVPATAGGVGFVPLENLTGKVIASF